ncbi:hypothetical protein [Kribbella sp. NPDC048928]|uniref:hypothetical protein n=1 Tax=Kribbella sp. NPDC048928 TaxID=3364111 RepID=UPI0037204884
MALTGGRKGSRTALLTTVSYWRPNSVGQVTYNYYPNRTRRHRVYVVGTSSVWNAFSAMISR